MKPNGFLDYFPIWAIYLLTPIVGLLAVEVGYRVAKPWQRRTNGKTEAPAAPVVAATLGLFAFLLAFTFGSASSRFEDRKQAVLAESGAIQSAYLRAAALPEPMASDSRNVLREYVDLRLSGLTASQIEQAIAKSEAMHKRLWSNAVAAANEKSPGASLFMTSLNDVINLHGKRVSAGLYNRVPPAIWIALYLLLLIAMAVIGYYQGMSGTMRSLAVIGLVVSFSMVLGLIADLDRPGQGRMQVSQQSMVDLQRSMETP